jgi:hypothetical protein
LKTLGRMSVELEMTTSIDAPSRGARASTPTAPHGSPRFVGSGSSGFMPAVEMIQRGRFSSVSR